MNSGTPSRKLRIHRAFLQLVLAAALAGIVTQGGCAVLSIPSYRADGCGPQGSAAPNTAGLDECNEDRYAPAFPTIPTPGFLKKWKEQKNLPKGPEGLKFHPLPTRPMFQPKPGSTPLDPNWSHDEFDPQSSVPAVNSSQFGAFPQRSQWSNALQPVDPSKSIHEGSIHPASEPTKLSQPGPVEEIPRP